MDIKGYTFLNQEFKSNEDVGSYPVNYLYVYIYMSV